MNSKTLKKLLISTTLCTLGLPLAQAKPLAPEPVTITVTNADNDENIQTAVVTLINQDTGKQYNSLSGINGTAQFSDIPPGNYKVQVEHDGYYEDRGSLNVSAGKEASYESLLLPTEGEELLITVNENLDSIYQGSPTKTVTKRDEDFTEHFITGTQTFQQIASTVPGLQVNSVGQVHARGQHRTGAVKIDGVQMPSLTSTALTQPILPELTQGAEIQVGNYSAAQGGQSGFVVDTFFDDFGDEYTELSLRAGNAGQLSGLAKLAYHNDQETFGFYLATQLATTDLGMEPVNPDEQELFNNADLQDYLLRFYGQGDQDFWSLNLIFQSNDFEVPVTPQNFANNVEKHYKEDRFTVLGSWRHDFDDYQSIITGLTFSNSNQKLNNNGRWTPWTPVPMALSDELFEEGFPAQPENPGSPYLPTTETKVTQWQGSLDYRYAPSEDHFFETGLFANLANTKQDILIGDPGGGGGLPSYNSLLFGSPAFQANVDRDSTLLGVYLSHTIPLGDDFSLNYGVRAETFNLSDAYSTGQISPNANLAWTPNEYGTLRLSYNRLFEAPPLDLDPTGEVFISPQRVHAFELSYQHQFGNTLAKAALIHKDFRDQVDIALLVPNSAIPLYAPLNFPRARYQGLELGITSNNLVGFNYFLTGTYSVSKPLEANAFADHIHEYNDHDQRFQSTGGISYTWDNDLNLNADFFYGSGFPQEAIHEYEEIDVAPYGITNERVSRFIVNLGATIPVFRPNQGAEGFQGDLTLKVNNLFDNTELINLYSEFSGTRFQRGRTFEVGFTGRF